MHASFNFVATLLLIASAIAPALSAPIESRCVLILFTIEIRLISCSAPQLCTSDPDACLDGFGSFSGMHLDESLGFTSHVLLS